MEAFKKIPKHVFLGILLFTIISGVSAYQMHQHVNSPDEAANRLFAKSWKNEQQLFSKNTIEQTKGYPLFPRSTAPAGDGIVPTGFVGLPIIFGSIAISLGEWSIFYLTIFFTIVAAIGWWYLIKNIFSRSVADSSLWLFLFCPAVLYYSVRGLFPNMLMADLLIISAAAGLYSFHRPSIAMFGLSVTAFFGAVATRPPEALVIAMLTMLALLVWGTQEVRARAKKILIGVLALGALMLFARWRGFMPGGYAFLDLSSLSSIFLPFGFYVSRILRAGYHFAFQLFLPFAIFSAIGLVYAVREYKNDKKFIAYTSCFVALSAWLLALYGSWIFSDNLKDPNAVTVGVSYVRYWIPIFVLSVPFIALLLEKFSARVRLVSIALFVVFGLWRSFFGMEGLLWVINEVNASGKTVQDIVTKVPENAVIAVRAWDKYFYPQRAVLQPFPRDVRTFVAVRELVERKTPVYAFIETMKESDRLWLRDNGFILTAVEVYGFNTLYEVNLWNAKQ